MRLLRWLELVALTAEGLTMREIADRLSCSPNTIKGRQDEIRLKLGARNTTHAVHLADQQGLLEAA